MPLIDSADQHRNKKTDEEISFYELSRSEAGVTDWTRIYFAVVIGLSCGFIGVLFRHLVEIISRATYLASIGDSLAFWVLPSWSILLILPAAALAAAILVYRYAPEAAGTGSAAYIAAFHHRNAFIRPVVTVVKFIASAIMLGFGASGGFEGPIVLIGSGAGSWISGKIKKIRKDAHIYMVTGASAGIGAVFMAPLGGALTAIEMLYREDYETRALVPALAASLTGYFTASLFGRPDNSIQLLDFRYQGIIELPAYILLTVLCSASGWVFVKIFDSINNYCENSTLPSWYFPFFGAAGTAVIALFFPHVLGPRFSILADIVRNYPGFMIVFAIFAAKIFATCLSIGTGGSGGVFGPALVIGGLLGIGFSRFLSFTGIPLIVPSPESMMLVGMAGFFAAVSKAPFGSVIMVCEITGTFELLPPLFVVCLLSIVMTKNFTIYKSQVDNRFKSPAHSHRLEERMLSGLLVYDFMEPCVPETVPQDFSFKDLADILKQEGDTYFPLVAVDRRKKIRGLIKFEKYVDFKYVKGYPETTSVKKILDYPACVMPDDDLHKASMLMIKYGYNRLPVVDSKDCTQLIGRINRDDIMKIYAAMR